MSERTIRTLAKKLAGEFYEGKRGGRFRDKNSLTAAKRLFKEPISGNIVEKKGIVPFLEAYPNAQAYITAHHPLFYDTARQCLTSMLGLPDSRISPFMKESIFKALIEDREKQHKQEMTNPNIHDLIGQRAPD